MLAVRTRKFAIIIIISAKNDWIIIKIYKKVNYNFVTDYCHCFVLL